MTALSAATILGSIRYLEGIMSKVVRVITGIAALAGILVGAFMLKQGSTAHVVTAIISAVCLVTALLLK